MQPNTVKYVTVTNLIQGLAFDHETFSNRSMIRWGHSDLTLVTIERFVDQAYIDAGLSEADLTELQDRFDKLTSQGIIYVDLEN